MHYSFFLEALEQIIKCYVISNIFPLYSEENTITLPESLKVIDDFRIEDWDKIIASNIIEFGKFSPISTKTFISFDKFTVDWNLEI